MAFITDSFLIPAALGAVDALVPLAAQQMLLEWGFDGDIRELHKILKAIQDLLRKAKGTSPELIKKWIKDLKSGISHAEKVLDELEYEAVRRKIEVRNRMRNKVRDFLSISNPLAFRLKLVLKLKHINLELDDICQEGYGILSHIPMTNDDVQPWGFRGILSFVNNSEIVGRDGDVSRVRDMLLGSSEDDLSVIAIVGMAGLGKTTLAQLIYNDAPVRYCFRVQRMWSCVSGEIKAVKLLNEMIQSLTRDRSEIANIEGAVRKLQGMLRGRRYLLVLDDVWDTNANEWVDMRNYLQAIGGSKGSKILVTTRFREVVLTMQASLTHELGKLSSSDSWTLFRKIAFADGGPRETQSLVEIGKKLVENCKGEPLVIKSLASLLSLTFKHDESEWMSMYYDEAWSSASTKPEILEVV